MDETNAVGARRRTSISAYGVSINVSIIVQRLKNENVTTDHRLGQRTRLLKL